jgi:nucleoside-diphosphate kinase
MDRTFIICKPDAVERGLAGEILARFERRGLRFVRVELRTIDRATAERHYGEHVGKPFFESLLTFITRGPSLLAVIAGPADTWQVVRTMMGATNPTNAAPGTIRGDLAIDTTENLVHGSDSAESAAREISLFFGSKQLGIYPKNAGTA